MLTILFNQWYRASSNYNPTGGGGGEGSGGTSKFYRGRYRYDVRRAIARAQRELSQPITRQKKRRKVLAQIAKTVLADVGPAQINAPVPIEFEPLETLRSQIATIASAVDAHDAQADAKRQELAVLFEQYQEAVRKIERDEEEQAIAIILALAA